MKRLAVLFLLVSMVSLLIFGCSNEEEPEVYEEVLEDILPEVEEEVETIIEMEEEEEVEEELPEVAPTGELSDDLYSFQVQLNGHVFQLPFDWSYAENLGWELGDTFEGDLGPNQRTFSSRVWHGNTRANMSIGNMTPNNIPIEEGIVGEVRVDQWDLDSGIEIVLPGGVTLGSPASIVIELYGEPTETRGTDSFRRYIYSVGIQQSIEIRISEETDEVDEIKVMNFVERQESAFDGELSELARGYTPPSSLGEDNSLGIVELEGVVYQLPIPVAVLLNNGWILEDEAHMIPAGRVAVGQRIRYGNQVMRVQIKNYDVVEVPAVEGFLITVEFNIHQWQGNIALPGGITPDSTEAEIMAILGTPTREHESQTFHGFTWHVTRYDTMRESIEISFNTEEGTVHSISVERDLRELSWW